jgi:3-mercaptopyruvate sulfurtransferase SseA
LAGGFDAWIAAGYPSEAKSTRSQTGKEVAENVAAAEGQQESGD